MKVRRAPSSIIGRLWLCFSVLGMLGILLFPRLHRPIKPWQPDARPGHGETADEQPQIWAVPLEFGVASGHWNARIFYFLPKNVKGVSIKLGHSVLLNNVNWSGYVDTWHDLNPNTRYKLGMYSEPDANGNVLALHYVSIPPPPTVQ